CFWGRGASDPLTTRIGFMVIILAGTARNWGVPVGAAIYGVLYAATRFLDFAPFSWVGTAERSYLRLIIVGAVLVALMAFRPQGIFGGREELVLEWCGAAARGGRPRLALRRRPAGRRGDLRCAARVDRLADRGERRGHDDGVQRDRRLSPRGRRARAVPGAADRPQAELRDRAGRARPDVPERPRADADD